MKFLRDKSLRELGIYLLVLICLIYFAEYFIINHFMNRLTEVEKKLEYTRTTQIGQQEISGLVQRYHSGQKDVAVSIEARLVQQDHLLEVLGKGGRAERTDIILKPLTRLPKISYDNLVLYWTDYKQIVRRMMESPVEQPTQKTEVPQQQPVDTLASDSLAAMQPVAQTSEAVATATPATDLSAWRIREESLGVTLINWYNNIFQDIEEEVAARETALHASVITIVAFDVLLLILIYYAFVKSVLQPLEKLKRSVAAHEQINDFPSNEIGKLTLQINETLEHLKDATDIVTSIGQGNLDMDYKTTLDGGYSRGNNLLADSLIDMQSKLKELNDEERKRQWANDGLAKFVDILRSSNDNLNELGDKIIAALSQYTRSNQGALYILNDENESDKHLELISLFAFDIKKFETRKIKLGEGLLGQTFLERETNYYSNFPDEYVRITSGLGDANPRSILIVPLKLDTQVYGIVELASFHEYQPHEIAFVEKLGETIASTIGSVRAAQKNRQLIEQFQMQNEQMRAQEEEMRQNMEELQATQEEIARKERGYIHRIEELENKAADNSALTALEKSNANLLQREKTYLEKIGELKKIQQQPVSRADDWQVAEELAHTLKTNLEALAITQEELSRKK
jgi:putative methionine-R-sulfoxide reductase with GAF domain